MDPTLNTIQSLTLGRGDEIKIEPQLIFYVSYLRAPSVHIHTYIRGTLRQFSRQDFHVSRGL